MNARGEHADHPLFDCYFGRRGCIETLPSGLGLTRELHRQGGATSSAAGFTAGAGRGDPECLAAIERYA